MGEELSESQLMIELKKIELSHDNWRRDFAAELGYPTYTDIFKPFVSSPEILEEDNDAWASDSGVNIQEILPVCSIENYDNIALNPYLDPYDLNCVSTFDAWDAKALKEIKKFDESMRQLEEIDDLEIDEELMFPTKEIESISEYFKNIHVF
ncbi:MAG: hypothetical protein JXA43_02715 [Candidatus Diapherotrites archaeon]|nr:hypothetical protein [Candidatus Diapherotrites archaeon]